MFDLEEMVQSAKKLFQRRDILIILSIILLYFLTRLIFLDRFPVFNDEGIYIHWAKIARADAAWRFISLTDGKQPLQTWGTMPLLKFFPTNALLAGRLFSVITGFIALTGLFSLLYYLFGKRTAFFGALLYILTPYFLFYDRLAMVDSGVNAAVIWIFFFSILLARYRDLGMALTFGLITGLSLLAKSSVRIFLGLSVLAPVLFFEKNKKKFSRNAVNFLVLYCVAGVLALVIYNIQRLSPFFHIIAEKNNTFVSTFAELRQNPFGNFVNNVGNIPLFVLWESGFVLPLLGICGLFVMYKKNIRFATYLLLWIVLPYIAVAFVSKVLFPRYIIFFPTLFLIPAALFLASIKKRAVLAFALSLFTVIALYFNYTIIADYAKIPFPPIDRGQYLEGWPAGYGIKEIVSYAREKSKEKPVILLADGNFGMAGDALDTYLEPGDRITIRGYWPLEEKQLRENQKDMGENYVYAVMVHKLEYPDYWPLKLVKRFDKPGNQSVVYLFELTP